MKKILQNSDKLTERCNPANLSTQNPTSLKPSDLKGSIEVTLAWALLAQEAKKRAILQTRGACLTLSWDILFYYIYNSATLIVILLLIQARAPKP